MFEIILKKNKKLNLQKFHFLFLQYDKALVIDFQYLQLSFLKKTKFRSSFKRNMLRYVYHLLK